MKIVKFLPLNYYKVLEVSDKPTDLILLFLQKIFKSSILIAPSHIEYWV